MRFKSLTNPNLEELTKYMLSLHQNNIENICNDIQVINLGCNHNDILEEVTNFVDIFLHEVID